LKEVREGKARMNGRRYQQGVEVSGQTTNTLQGIHSPLLLKEERSVTNEKGERKEKEKRGKRRLTKNKAKRYIHTLNRVLG
jgi:hypothetical protein